ncbi:hypothetical protein HA402_001315 [Bradysia odoriphaga]|nr:hypothetical protein HA402_001315 [Bradysia odoriphaga]
MKILLVVIFVVLGTAYGRSIPVKSSDISVDDINGSPIPLIRKVRQFGYGGQFGQGQYGGQYGQGQYGGQYGQGQYGGQYGQGQYGQGQYGQGQYGQGQGYNNFDLNPFNDSPNNYDLNPFNNTYGKKKK